MGRHYAEKSGEDPCIVSAMEEQYLPRHSGDSLPQSKCGLVLSIADKVDTLVGIFAIGERPTGDKDPYALRRASIGLLRILIETPLPLDLKDVLDFSAEELRDKVDARFAAAEVFTYSMERLKAYYDDQNIEGDVVDSVLTIGLRVPSDIHRRVLAVESFRLLPEARALTSSNKRIANILRKSQDRISGKVDISMLKEEAEQRLQKRAEALESAISPLLDEQDYRSALKALSGLRKDIDIFFEQVMVMTEKHDLRSNRLGLLRSVQSLFLKVADISLLK
jgi:glycyl-tRNA synthetase beta chain